MVKNVLNTLRKKQKNNKGFSLVELIVVIAIMAVLVGVLAPQFIKYVESSRQSTDMQNIQQLKSAVEAAVADNEGVTSVTITIASDAKTATVGNTVALDTTKQVTTLKSSHWQDVVYTLTTANGTWEKTSGNGANTEGKDPKKTLDDIFLTN